MKNNRAEKTKQTSKAVALWRKFNRTKKAALISTVSLVLLVGIIVSSTGMVSSSQAIASKCSLSIISGKAEVILQGAETRQPATDGMALDTGDRVITASDSRASLMFFDGSILTLEPGTDIEIEKLEKNGKQSRTIILKQWIGKTFSRVAKVVDSNSQYEIETPSALAAVRGTQFFTEVDNSGKTRVSTTEGTVSVVGQGKEVLLPIGWQTEVETGTAPIEPQEFDVSEYVMPDKNQKKDVFHNRSRVETITGNDQPTFSKVQTSIGLSADGTLSGTPVVQNLAVDGADSGKNAGTSADEDYSNRSLDKKNKEENSQDNEKSKNIASAVSRNQGNGNANGQGNGNGNASGQGNGNAGGQDNGNAGGQGNGNASGQGNGNASGQGNGNASGQGNGNANGQGNGNAGGQDNGNANNQGNGNAGGHDNGNANNQGNGNASGQDNGNGKNKDKSAGV